MSGVISFIEALDRAENIDVSVVDVEGEKLNVASEETLDEVVSQIESLGDGSDLSKVVEELEAGEISNILSDIENSFKEFDGIETFKPVSVVDDEVEELQINTGGRPFINAYYNVEADTEVVFEASNESDEWREIERVDTEDGGVEQDDEMQFSGIAREYFRVRFTEEIAGTIDISASR